MQSLPSRTSLCPCFDMCRQSRRRLNNAKIPRLLSVRNADNLIIEAATDFVFVHRHWLLRRAGIGLVMMPPMMTVWNSMCCNGTHIITRGPSRIIHSMSTD